MNEDYKKDSNRAFETAKLTSFWLYLAKIPEALEFGKRIGLDKMDRTVIPNAEEMCFLNPIIHEIRYKTINHYAEKSGCKNVLDIACGYSPRGVKLTRDGFNYYGADFPVVVEELNPIVEDMGVKNCKYYPVDATNYESLCKVTDEIEGPICIVVEGLEMYLTEDESAIVRENIARTMSKHEGSVYVTTDPANGHIMSNVIRKTFGLWRFIPTIGMFFHMYNWASDGGITMQTAKLSLGRYVRRFAETGLEAKRCSLLLEDEELLTFDCVDERAKRKLKKVLRKEFTFVSKLLPGKTFETNTNRQNFSIDAKIEDEALEMAIKGRIDTLSAPKILEAFDKQKSNINSVEIDMKQVEYVSSAGARVFYLIEKELGGKQFVKFMNMSEDVEQSLANDEIIERI